MSPATEQHDDPTPCVLVVDDDAQLRQLLKVYLGDLENLRVRLAGNGLEALQSVAEEVPDLVLMDCMMPEMNGVDACYAIKSSPASAHVPVILFTAIADFNELDAEKRATADQLIGKPFNLTALRDAVRAYLPGRR